MADKKITDLPNAGTVATTDLAEMVVAGTSSKVALSVMRAAMVPVAVATEVSGLAAGIGTWLTTPSGGNLGAALTSALTVAKGGTGATASTGSGNVVLAAGPTLTGVTTVSALRLTGSTGNASTGTINDVSLGGNRRVRFTNAAGPVITGLDATGIADGDIVYLTAFATSITVNHEDAGSLAANRFSLRGGAARTLPAPISWGFIYDGTSSRWLEMGASYSNP